MLNIQISKVEPSWTLSIFYHINNNSSESTTCHHLFIATYALQAYTIIQLYILRALEHYF